MMKQIVLIAILVLFVYRVALCPSISGIIIVKPEPIKPFERLIYAINMVEAGIDSIRFDTMAYNPVEEAAGAFQIRICRLEDYNRKTGKDYKPEDLFDYSISKEIFLFYTRGRSVYDLESIARSWNGSGPKTIEYWQKVKVYL